MKNFILFLAFFFLAFNPLLVNAQTDKFAYINMNDLLQLMPQVTQAEKELAGTQAEYESALRTMTLEYQGKIQDFQTQRNGASEVVQQALVAEIQDMEKRIAKFQQDAQSRLQKRQQELFEPIRKTALDAVSKIAKSKGYTYVFDISQPVNVIYYQGGINILPQVKKALGL